MRDLLVLAGFIALCLGVGFVSATAAPPGAWYRALAKPEWTPPNAVFPIAWTALYALMGIAAWLVWRQAGLAGAAPALALFAVQLLLNGLWSWLFFGLHRPGWALLDLALLWLAIAATMATFARHVPLAAWLLAPYLAWVTYAGALNAAIRRLNP